MCSPLGRDEISKVPVHGPLIPCGDTESRIPFISLDLSSRTGRKVYWYPDLEESEDGETEDRWGLERGFRETPQDTENRNPRHSCHLTQKDSEEYTGEHWSGLTSRVLSCVLWSCFIRY